MLLLLALSITLMIFDYRQQHLQALRAFLSTLVTPAQYVVSWPGRLLTATETNLATHSALLSENAELRNQGLMLNARLQKMLALEQENKQLRELLKAAPHTGADRVLIAQLLAVNSDPFVNELLIDKGSESGVFVGQQVLDANGIMGQVMQVNPMSSRVLLITDIRSAVPVQNVRTGSRAVAAGLGSLDTLSLLNVPVTADVRVGDAFLSSGLDGRYTAGYPMGIVESVQSVPGEQFAKISVKPNAQINRSQQVLLIWAPANNLKPSRAR
jgi:rod shape-determining protein MreC